VISSSFSKQMLSMLACPSCAESMAPVGPAPQMITLVCSKVESMVVGRWSICTIQYSKGRFLVVSERFDIFNSVNRFLVMSAVVMWNDPQLEACICQTGAPQSPLLRPTLLRSHAVTTGTES
jgi:hypothetical protein